MNAMSASGSMPAVSISTVPRGASGGRRTEDLVRFGEPSEQVFEVAPSELMGHAPHHLRLGRARRSNNEDVLAGDGSKKQHFHEGITFE